MLWEELVPLLKELESGEDSIPESGFELDEAGLALSGVVGPAVAKEEPSVVVEEAVSEVEAVSSEVGLTTDLLRLRDVTEAMEEAAKARSGVRGLKPRPEIESARYLIKKNCFACS